MKTMWFLALGVFAFPIAIAVAINLSRTAEVTEEATKRHSAPAEPDFRNVSWGMSKAEVQAEVTEEATKRHSAPAESDFRNVSWGMSKIEVRAIETATHAPPDMSLDTPNRPKDHLLYVTELAGVSIYLAYFFVDDKLSSALCGAMDGQLDKLSLEDIDRIRSALAQEHGEPVVDREVWSEEPDSMMYHTEWEKETMSVVINFGTSDSHPGFAIMYESKVLAPLAETLTKRSSVEGIKKAATEEQADSQSQDTVFQRSLDKVRDPRKKIRLLMQRSKQEAERAQKLASEATTAQELDFAAEAQSRSRALDAQLYAQVYSYTQSSVARAEGVAAALQKEADEADAEIANSKQRVIELQQTLQDTLFRRSLDDR